MGIAEICRKREEDLVGAVQGGTHAPKQAVVAGRREGRDLHAAAILAGAWTWIDVAPSYRGTAEDFATMKLSRRSLRESLTVPTRDPRSSRWTRAGRSRCRRLKRSAGDGRE
jgi:hypothetical protein